jgi:type IV pilus assembly protein PilB
LKVQEQSVKFQRLSVTSRAYKNPQKERLMADPKEIGRRGKNERRSSVDRRRLGELLVETGLLTREKLREALTIQKNTGERLGRVLIDMNVITEDEIGFALAMQLRIPFMDLRDYPIEAQVIESIPEEICRKFVCIPIDRKDSVLHVSMADPLDLNMMKEIQFVTGYNIQPAVSISSQILDRLQTHYHPQKPTAEVTEEALAKEEFLELRPDVDTSEREVEIQKLKDSPFVKMVDLIIKNAIKRGASDIHIEAQENHVRVRNRIDGVLQDAIKLPKWTQPIIISRIKVLGGMDIAEKRLPQDGRIKVVKASDFSVDLRVSTLPTFYGEKAVIRILNKSQAFLSLDDLGLSKDNLSILKRLIRRPQGMILITGPTGSGKTSTLYACMREIKSDETNIITVEDPVEYELSGINQVQINEKVGLTFPYILRSILRQDPNILMVGEIRDQETAEIALQASMTGHLVLSTLHTNDAPSAVTRLVDIGMPPFLIASSVVAVIAQRLVRAICTQCKEEYVPNPDLLSRFNMTREKLPFQFFRGAGCAACGNTGFSGRSAIEELMIVGYKIRELIQSGASSDTIREAAMATGLTTLGYSGLQKIRMGITTIDEVLKAVYQKEELTTICSHCGKAVSLDFKDCPFCRHPLVPSCNSCGRVVQPDWMACPYCANRLKLETPT